MKKKVIYVSGKITGTSDYADRFSAAEDKLIAEGYEVLNPVRTGKWLERYLAPEKPTWVQYMKCTIAAMMKADYIYMMSGWSQSKGARIEHKLARELGMEIIYEIKKPVYNAEYRRAQYVKHRDKILQKQKEYDDQHREEINRKARARYRAKCGLKAIKEA